jgi:phosphopantetheine adenylyltransferase
MKTTTFPQAAFFASADPMHGGHKNTINLASNVLKLDVALVIGHNVRKEEGVFTLDERRQIAKHFLPDHLIYVAKDLESLKQFLIQAEYVVVGIRDQRDRDDTEKLSAIYQLQELRHKLVFIDVPEDLSFVSSTYLKELVRMGGIADASKWLPTLVVEMLSQKLRA